MKAIIDYRDDGGARGSGWTELQTNLPTREACRVFPPRQKHLLTLQFQNHEESEEKKNEGREFIPLRCFAFTILFVFYLLS